MALQATKTTKEWKILYFSFFKGLGMEIEEKYLRTADKAYLVIQNAKKC